MLWKLCCNGLGLCAIIMLIEHIFYNNVYFCLERNMAYGRKNKSRGNTEDTLVVGVDIGSTTHYARTILKLAS